MYEYIYCDCREMCKRFLYVTANGYKARGQIERDPLEHVMLLYYHTQSALHAGAQDNTLCV